jgi:hypothetical protein
LLKSVFLSHFMKGSAHVLYHVLLVALSTGIAFSLPALTSFIAQKLLFYWSFIEDEKVFLIAAEIALAILFVLLFNYIGASWKNRRTSQMARSSGMVYCFPPGRFFAQRRVRKLKQQQGLNRDILIISATGVRTFVDPQTDLHGILEKCREARIMLLNPHSDGARARSKSMLNPNVTPELFDQQIRKSIDFLKELKVARKNITLKLYDDPPYLKLAILGDYLWMKHYHPGLDVHSMPEYVFKHDQNPGALYTPFYQYFLMRWKDSNIPEYDLDTDELIYRDMAGNEIRRETFNEPRFRITPQNADTSSSLWGSRLDS